MGTKNVLPNTIRSSVRVVPLDTAVVPPENVILMESGDDLLLEDNTTLVVDE